MTQVTLDRGDVSLLKVLQQEGAITNAALADRVFMSASQVSRRRQELERSGVIRGYRAEVDRAKVGLSVVAFVSVTLVRHSPENSARVRSLIKETPWITDAYALSGDSDFLFKVVARDLHEYFNFVTNCLLAHEAVEKVRTDIVLDLVKEDGPVPLEGSAPGNP
jgi:DNA-binding Lrp family transcriptional regulator